MLITIDTLYNFLPIFQIFYKIRSKNKLVNYFLNVSNLFLSIGIKISIFKIYEIISYFINFSNYLLIELIRLSFHKYFNI